MPWALPMKLCVEMVVVEPVAVTSPSRAFYPGLNVGLQQTPFDDWRQRSSCVESETWRQPSDSWVQKGHSIWRAWRQSCFDGEDCNDKIRTGSEQLRRSDGKPRENIVEIIRNRHQHWQNHGQAQECRRESLQEQTAIVEAWLPSEKKSQDFLPESLGKQSKEGSSSSLQNDCVHCSVGAPGGAGGTGETGAAAGIDQIQLAVNALAQAKSDALELANKGLVRKSPRTQGVSMLDGKGGRHSSAIRPHEGDADTGAAGNIEVRLGHAIESSQLLQRTKSTPMLDGGGVGHASTMGLNEGTADTGAVGTNELRLGHATESSRLLQGSRSTPMLDGGGVGHASTMGLNEGSADTGAAGTNEFRMCHTSESSQLPLGSRSNPMLDGGGVAFTMCLNEGTADTSAAGTNELRMGHACESSRLLQGSRSIPMLDGGGVGHASTMGLNEGSADTGAAGIHELRMGHASESSELLQGSRSTPTLDAGGVGHASTMTLNEGTADSGAAGIHELRMGHASESSRLLQGSRSTRMHDGGGAGHASTMGLNDELRSGHACESSRLLQGTSMLERGVVGHASTMSQNEGYADTGAAGIHELRMGHASESSEVVQGSKSTPMLDGGGVGHASTMGLNEGTADTGAVGTNELRLGHATESSRLLQGSRSTPMLDGGGVGHASTMGLNEGSADTGAAGIHELRMGHASKNGELLQGSRSSPTLDAGGVGHASTMTLNEGTADTGAAGTNELRMGHASESSRLLQGSRSISIGRRIVEGGQAEQEDLSETQVTEALKRRVAILEALLAQRCSTQEKELTEDRKNEDQEVSTREPREPKNVVEADEQKLDQGSLCGKGGKSKGPSKGTSKGQEKDQDTATGGKGGPSGKNGKGKTPPKAPPKTLAKAAAKCKDGPQPRKVEIRLERPMKKLFWNSFVLDDELVQAQANVWAVLEHEGMDGFDVQEFEQLFSEGSFRPGPSGSAALGGSRRRMRARVFEESRRRQVCIMLARLPPVETTVKAVQRMDDSILDKDQVELLLSTAPSGEELTLLHSAAQEMPEKDKGLPWDDAEDFVLKLAEVASFRIRLQTWSFQNAFDERYEILHGAVTEVKDACHSLQDSHRVQRLLGMVLGFGNHLNAGTARGRADGFSVEVLPQMRALKGQASSSSTTLLDFLVRQAEKSEPGELANLFGDVGEATLVQKACRHKLSDLSHELNAYCSQASELARAASSGDADLVARAKRTQARIRELEALQQLFVEAEEDYKNMCVWFHEGGGKKPRPPDEFFGYWHAFFRA